MERSIGSLERRQVSKTPINGERRKVSRRQLEQAVEIDRRRRNLRGSDRIPLSAEVTLFCLNSKIDCIPTDINLDGIGVVIAAEPDLFANYTVMITFSNRASFNFSARILHVQKTGDDFKCRIGLQFSTGTEWEKTLLSTVVASVPKLPIRSAAEIIPDEIRPDLHVNGQLEINRQFNENLKIERYLLLVNGEELDTGSYEYFPFAEKVITDRKTTMKMIHGLKKGELPEGYEKYVYAQYCVGTRDTNRRAIQAAYEASLEFRYWPLKKRKKILEDIFVLLMQNKEKLIDLMVIEGHPRSLARWEFEGIEGFKKNSLDFYSSQLENSIKIKSHEQLYLKRRADGVVCVLPPKNASCSNSLIAAFALLAGNALILKPPLRNPIATVYAWDRVVNAALIANNAPKGVLNIINGNSKQVLDEWIKSPLVNDILFFGDSLAGIKLGAEIYQADKKPILELSGNDLMFVWKDASLNQSISSLLDGFLASTQICMVPKKALIHDAIFDDFKNGFISEVKKMKVGLPTQDDVLLSPVAKIAEFYQFLDEAVLKGAKLLCGGERVDYLGRCDKNGIFITPAVLEIDDVESALAMRCFNEEVFFPLIPLIKVNAGSSPEMDKDNMIFNKMAAVAQQHSFGLRISAWVSSKPVIQKFCDRFDNSGLLRINSRHVGFSEGLSGHGGTKRSGGPFGEMNYVWQRTSHLQGVSITDPNIGETKIDED